MTHSDVVRFPAGDHQPIPPDMAALQEQIRGLQSALLSLPVIEQAKGVVMLQYRIDAETAFAVLDRVSRDTNIKIREIAALVCEVSCGHQRPDPSADPVLAHVLDQLAPVATTPAAEPGDPKTTTPTNGRPPPSRLPAVGRG
ncbi:ANTAR domain-containing protein [Flexivirga alba]|uniref:ANTAR domain-containing protein n=1 Tax=Flexivirga alba TaxID=702742 RepID=A0ABW2AJF9_9MICO